MGGKLVFTWKCRGSYSSLFALHERDDIEWLVITIREGRGTIGLDGASYEAKGGLAARTEPGQATRKRSQAALTLSGTSTCAMKPVPRGP